MKDRKGFGAGTVVIALLLGLAVGGAGGYVLGTNSVSTPPSVAEEAPATQSQTEAVAAEVTVETQPDAEEEMADAAGNFAFDQELVITVGSVDFFIDEINTRVYMARDTYVSQFGEDPWDQPMPENEDITVGEYAKEQILDDLKRIVILQSHAEEYGVAEPTEEDSNYTQLASEYMGQLGDQVSSEFGVTLEALYKIYKDDAYAMAVYNAILDQLTEELKADESYAAMADDEFEAVLMERYNALYDQWYEAIQWEPTSTWDALSIGSVG